MKYLEEKDIVPDFSFDFEAFTPISTDTYDESEVSKSILSHNVEHLFACALQFAIIGTGNNSYGRIKINGFEYNVESLLKENGVKMRLSINSKLEPGDLTLKRLARFFRFHISKYIKITGTYSFLYLKYANQGHPEYTFPCAEYLITKGQEQGLLSAYQALDQSSETRFFTRILQILRTRKVISQKTS
jgi:hypothetical protein